MEKLVSVIIPCYNVEKYIDKCMESLLNQTLGLDNMELIFVNDASTDSTYERLLEYEKKYSDSILVINQSENRRQGAARNAGMKFASGEYIGFCDSDDWAEPDMFEVMYNALKESDADYVVCARYEDFPDGQQGIFGPEEDGFLELEHEEFKQLISGTCAPGGVYQHLYKREFLEKADVWFPEMIRYEDNYFVGILVYYVQKIAMVKKPLYHYRINPESTVQARNKLWHLDRLESELLRIKELERRGLFRKYHTDIEHQFLKLFFINTIGILINKFDEIPVGVVSKMQSTVKGLFPNWKENILLKECMSDNDKVVASLIDYPFVTGSRNEVLYALNAKLEARDISALTMALLKLIRSMGTEEQEKKSAEEVRNIWNNWDDEKKKEILNQYFLLYGEEPRKYILFLYFLFRTSLDMRIYSAILQYIESDKVDCLYGENIRKQLSAVMFKNNIIIDYETEREINDILINKWKREYGKIDFIPWSERNSETVLMTTDQFLFEQHAPTKIMMEICKILMGEGYKVCLLVNDVNYSEKVLQEKFVVSMSFAKREELEGRTVFDIGKDSITCLQVNYLQETEKAFDEVKTFLREIKPQFVWHIGGTCFISDVIGESSTFISTKCTDGYAVSNAPILASLMVGDNEYCHQSIRYIEKTGQKTCHFLSPIASGYEQKKQGVTRKEYGLPEGKFLICLVGNRLDEEINVEFIQWMESVADMSEDILFVTIGTGKTIWKNSGYEDRVIHMGYQKELTDVLSCMNVYVNPPRRGGGGSSVAAMAAGIPAFTLGGCDVAYSVNENFVVGDLEEMKRKVLRCQEDVAFYRQKCKDAKETFDKVKELNCSGEQKKSVLTLLKIAEEMSV